MPIYPVLRFIAHILDDGSVLNVFRLYQALLPV